jgi:hypothetical protein
MNNDVIMKLKMNLDIEDSLIFPFFFRGKRNIDGVWTFGNLKIENGRKDVFINPVDTGGYHMVDPSTVGQFTGYKDLDDNYIWVGDIISLIRPVSVTKKEEPVPIEEELYEVYFSESGFKVMRYYNNDNFGVEMHLEDLCDSHFIEVVSNIHDEKKKRTLGLRDR